MVNMSATKDEDYFVLPQVYIGHCERCHDERTAIIPIGTVLPITIEAKCFQCGEMMKLSIKEH
jgi:hypothetical protein